EAAVGALDRPQRLCHDALAVSVALASVRRRAGQRVARPHLLASLHDDPSASGCLCARCSPRGSCNGGFSPSTTSRVGPSTIATFGIVITPASRSPLLRLPASAIAWSVSPTR